jgi:beta-galactosidase
MKFKSNILALDARSDATISSYSTQSQSEHPSIKANQIAQASAAPPVKLGPSVSWRSTGVAMAPESSEFNRSAKWSISLSPGSWNGVENLWLDIDYDGDVARLSSGGKLLVDNFYNGQVWHVGLNRFREQIAREGLELAILPRRRDAPIFLETTDSTQADQILELRGVTVRPEYEFRLMLPPSQ